jgi:hypothetical protein
MSKSATVGNTPTALEYVPARHKLQLVALGEPVELDQKNSKDESAREIK